MTKIRKEALIYIAKEAIMGVSFQEVANIKIIISDCRSCQAWDQIKPLLYRLYEHVKVYNQARHEIMEPADITVSGIHLAEPTNVLLHLKKVREVIVKLHGKGVHFMDLDSLDIFCEAYELAMVNEFGEDEMKVSAY
ncbi:MAG: hypothetical protein P1P90_02275 [Patescibacteria group bacterium]|nr:hypothetical protein [Patescibacteria group bacterium]